MDKLPAMPPKRETWVTRSAHNKSKFVTVCAIEDYDALRSVAQAYLEALEKAVQSLEQFERECEWPYCHTARLALASLGKLPERAP
jgi:dsDNA-binding SOS-regulon protein